MNDYREGSTDAGAVMQSKVYNAYKKFFTWQIVS